MEREVSEVDRKLLLKKTYLDKIAYFINRNPINQDELYLTVRKFFGEYLKLDYEFTYEELSQELNKVFIKPKVKERIDDFLIRLSESEYLEETTLGTPEINAFLTELDEIIQNVIYDDQPAHDDGTILQKVLKIKSKSSEKLIDMSSMTSSIEEMNFHITSGNIDIAKKLYVELLKNYDTLNREDKKKLHEGMNEVYERLQTLMKNPKSKIAVVSQSISDSVKKVIDMSEETAFFITASNLNSAKKSYANTLALYDSLSLEDKKSLHPKINELYEKLQALSSMSSKTENVSTEIISAEKEITGLESSLKNVAADVPASVAVPANATTDMTDATATAHDITYGSEANSFDFNTAVSSASTTSSASNNISDNSFAQPLENSSVSSSMTSDNTLFHPNIQPNVQPGVVSLSNSASAGESQMTTDIKPNTSISEPPTEQNVLFTFNEAGSEHHKNVDALARVKSSDSLKSSANMEVNVNEQRSKPVMSKVISEPRSVSVQTSVTLPISSPAVLPSVGTSGDQKSIFNDKNNISISATKIIPQVIPKVISQAAPQAISKAIPVTKLEGKFGHEEIASGSIVVTKLNSLLKKINEDILMDKLDKAKESYKDALLVYKAMNVHDKTRCYDNFYLTFKKLDVLLHQKSLHELLDTHLLGLTNSQRPLISTTESQDKNMDKNSLPNIQSHAKSNRKSSIKSDIKSDVKSDSNKKHKRTELITQSPTEALPVVLSNDDDTTRVYELIEEAYFNMDNDNLDLAMLKYFKALDTYRKLSLTDKRKSYSDIYALFKRLSNMKRSLLVSQV